MQPGDMAITTEVPIAEKQDFTHNSVVAFGKLHDAAMAQPLLVIGGQQRAARSLLDQDQQWYDYQKGLILRVDPRSGTAETCLEYVSPPEATAPGEAVLFKSGTVQDGKLYLCTQTEVLVFSLPEFNQVAYISLPCFNDVHHVRPTDAGTLLVAVSGLDLVVEVSLYGEMLRMWDVYDGKPWSRFAREVDYRKGISTKPHRSHPNHLFLVDDEIWVTRFEQKDAICLNRPDRRIQIGTERVHDGFLHAGQLYFTTVNGHVVIADPVTLRVDEIIDLTTLHEPETLLGWCRGIWVEGSKAWVGFSRIRPTKFRETVSWVRSGFKQSLPTHMACYDLATRECLAEIELENGSLNAVFSIFPLSTAS